jgi:ribosomal protein L11
VASLEAKLSELQKSQQQLVATNAGIDRNLEDLKAVAKKVEIAAKAIGVVIDVTGKFATLA